MVAAANIATTPTTAASVAAGNDQPADTLDDAARVPSFVVVVVVTAVAISCASAVVFPVVATVLPAVTIVAEHSEQSPSEHERP